MIKAVYSEACCLKPFSDRKIKYAFHDIDGTHSLIRNWPPVMSIVLYDVIERGLPEGFDSDENALRLIQAAGSRPLPETDAFCVESAGLSALTQMEWAIRRAVSEGTVAVECDREANSRKIDAIWQGQERFSESDSPELTRLLSEKTPRLFKLYERVLNGFCRDTNLERAKADPEAFKVPGSEDFLRFLEENGVKNYFVTGAVVQRGMGMFEEVETLGYPIGPGCLIEDIIGSTWDKKLPKDEIMRMLLDRLNAKGEEVLVTGDGRSEISAGVQMNALTLSRLDRTAHKQRELHRTLGTCMIVEDFTAPAIKTVFQAE